MIRNISGVFKGDDYLSPVNSHIQIPKLILQNYMNEKGKVNYLDLRDNSLKFKGPRKLGTQYDYYLDENEDFLGKKIESPFGVVCSVFKQFQNAELETIKITPEFETVTKRFLYFLILRSGYMKMLYEKNSKIYSDGGRAQDILVEFGKNSKAPVMPYDSYKLNLLKNPTNLGLVALRNCWYDVPQNGYETIVMPISPKGAIILMHPKERALHVEGENLEYGNIENENIVKALNERALHVEYLQNRAFVAGNDNTELQRLQEILRREKDNYEDERKSLLDE